jgi:hypothetical protein
MARPVVSPIWSPEAIIAAVAHRKRADLASRRLHPRDDEPIKRYAQDIGLVIWASNNLHAAIFEIFWSLLGVRAYDRWESHLLANTLWHQIQNDSTQRDMMLDTARIAVTPDARAAKKIEWIVQMANKFGTYRNVAAHVPVLVSEGRLLADPAASRLQAGLRFRHINHETFWRVLLGDILALSHYARSVSQYPHSSLPRRPQLRSLRAIQEIETALALQTQRQGRSRRGRPSRPKRKPSGRGS